MMFSIIVGLFESPCVMTVAEPPLKVPASADPSVYTIYDCLCDEFLNPLDSGSVLLMLFRSGKIVRLVDVIHGGDSKKVRSLIKKGRKDIIRALCPFPLMFSGRLFSRSS